MTKPDLRLVESTLPPAAVAPAVEAHEQSEMPFAVVEGEPLTEMPRDLYIPPDALQVFLEAFEGPLDLLLYLIRRQNLDILDIPLAEITRQYMQYIEVMQELQLELAGEYMLMAATLAEIKSRMLLPRPQSDGAEEDAVRVIKREAAAKDIGATDALTEHRVVRLAPVVRRSAIGEFGVHGVAMLEAEKRAAGLNGAVEVRRGEGKIRQAEGIRGVGLLGGNDAAARPLIAAI
jgi:hypothetical protein